MNREETRKAAEVMMHYANGGEVEWRRKRDDEWQKAVSPFWNWDSLHYRIKPQPVEIRQWAVVNIGTFTVEAVHQYRQAAEQFMLGMAHHKFLAIIELKGTYTCDT